MQNYYIKLSLSILVCFILKDSQLVSAVPTAATTSITGLTLNPDCMSGAMSAIIPYPKVTNTAYTFGYLITLTSQYPVCQHDSFYGFTVLWNDIANVNTNIVDANNANAGLNLGPSLAKPFYYSWSLS